MSFIIDSSVALSWFFPDEATDKTQDLYAVARRSTLIVPALWHIEMANVLGQNLKRGRIKPVEMDEALSALAKLDIRTIPLRQSSDIASYTFQMRLHQLTAYDATYVMLAQDLALPLATFDGEMIVAAKRAGIALLQVQE